jgi:DNA-binding transcriptional MerR regulator
MSDHKTKMDRKSKSTETSLQPIPDKLYFTIGEVAELCALKTHVLRYWEQEFSQLTPSKRRGNRRYYQRKDVILVRQIQNLLYNQGYTIEGAKAQLVGEESIAIKNMQNSQAVLQSVMTQLETMVRELEEV